MPRKAELLKSLSRGRIRASFNKYNLFNLYKKGKVDFKSKSLYQQKWNAKQETRAYHGEYLTEKRFKTNFSSNLESVAQLDRNLRGGRLPDTPYMLQTYAILEKRLDFAIFRSMFASSVRQARQFILHGAVKVNGIQIKHPGYPLKPGDIFHVKPEKVLMALGTKKPDLQKALKVDKIQILLWNKYVKEAKENPKHIWGKKMNTLSKLPDYSPKKVKFNEMISKNVHDVEVEVKSKLKECTKEGLLYDLIQSYKATGKNNVEKLIEDDFSKIFKEETGLKKDAVEILKTLSKVEESFENILSVKDEKEQKALIKEFLNLKDDSKKALSQGEIRTVRDAKLSLSNLVIAYNKFLVHENISSGKEPLNLPYNANWSKTLMFHTPITNVKELIDKYKGNEYDIGKLISLPWQKGIFGREERKKPYFTPWKPRPFLSPFAILPHHIEISFKTCHAIYLRDPKARPGHSEVISPFNSGVHERAYMYYLRNGR